MDEKTVELLSRLYAEGREFDGTQPDRLNRRRNLEPESAAVLHSLIEGLKPAHLLELGTSNGYSTIWLADAVSPATALTTVDNDPGRAGEATENIAAAGFSDRITQLTGDGLDVLHAAADQNWEFIFLDAERSLYVQWWPELQRTLTDGGLLVVDNVLSHADQVAEFRALVDATAGFRSLVVPIGAGLLVIARQD